MTKRILAEQDTQVDAEDVSGQPSAWRDVYRKMRCPGPPCQNKNGYCWQVPVGKKHFKLLTHHLKRVARFVEDGHILETYDDVTADI